MVKFLNSLCCCIYSAEIRKSQRHDASIPQSSNLHSIITQITPDSQNGTCSVNGNGTVGTWSNGASAKNAPASGSVSNGCAVGENKENATTTVSCGTPYQSRGASGSPALLPRPSGSDANKKCLIVDLDETLVHSSFKPVKNADFIIPVEIDNIVHQVYVLKRPFADEFLERIGALFECVLFTASLAKYADPVADLLDKKRIFRARLFREACVYYDGNYIKDLDRLGRDVRNVIIIDNSPASYAFHPKNAVPVRTWFDDPNDWELMELLPVLEQLAKTDNIYPILQQLDEDLNQRATQLSYDEHKNAVVISTGAASGYAIGNGTPAPAPPPPASGGGVRGQTIFSPNIGADGKKLKT